MLSSQAQGQMPGKKPVLKVAGKVRKAVGTLTILSIPIAYPQIQKPFISSAALIFEKVPMFNEVFNRIV